jgi:hypothetical protein
MMIDIGCRQTPPFQNSRVTLMRQGFEDQPNFTGDLAVLPSETPLQRMPIISALTLRHERYV